MHASSLKLTLHLSLPPWTLYWGLQLIALNSSSRVDEANVDTSKSVESSSWWIQALEARAS